MPTDCELDPSDYLGIEHETFKSKMLTYGAISGTSWGWFGAGL